MNGNIGSRVRVPYYQPRLPGLGGGGGGVFQPAGGMPYKPNRLAEGIGGLGQLYGSYLQGSEVGRKRRMEEQTFPLELELLKARAEQYRRPRGTVYPESYQKDLTAAVDALNTGEYDVFQIFRSMAQRYPAQSAELRRILLAEEPASDLEAWLQMQPEFQKQWDETRPQKKQFQLPGATPFGITPLPGARPGMAPTPLPGAKYPAPTEWLRSTKEVPEVLSEGRKPVESREVPRKVPPGLEAIAKRKLESNFFDPEGTGYDYETAKRYGLKPDETGHWPSRVPETGQILKGRRHPTWYKTEEAETKLGNIIRKSKEGRYYSGRKDYGPIFMKRDKLPGVSKDETDVFSGLMRRTKEEPKKKAVPSKQAFEKYPAPKTEKEFDNTIKHIPSKEMKILYFETMIRRIEDEKLAKSLYNKWSDELYK